MTAAVDDSVAPAVWHADRASSDGAHAATTKDVDRSPAGLQIASTLRVAISHMLRAMCPHANETGIIDVLRDMHPDSILLGVLLTARLVSACDRIMQLTPLGAHELSANVLVCIVLAEKLLNDAPFTDLIAMVAAALDSEPHAVCQLEFRVLSILSVHEGTIVSADELAFFTRTVTRTGWRHLDAADCLATLRDYTTRRAVASTNGWRESADGRADSLSGDLAAYQRARSGPRGRSTSSSSSSRSQATSRSPPLKPARGLFDFGALSAAPTVHHPSQPAAAAGCASAPRASAGSLLPPPAPLGPLPNGGAAAPPSSWPLRFFSSLSSRLTPTSLSSGRRRSGPLDSTPPAGAEAAADSRGAGSAKVPPRPASATALRLGGGSGESAQRSLAAGMSQPLPRSNSWRGLAGSFAGGGDGGNKLRR